MRQRTGYQLRSLFIWSLLILSLGFIFESPLHADERKFRKALAEAGVKHSTIDYIVKTFTSRSPERVRELTKWIKSYDIEEPGKVIERAPELVGYTIETLQGKVRWLRAQGATDINRIIRNQPQIFSKDLETMDKVIA